MTPDTTALLPVPGPEPALSSAGAVEVLLDAHDELACMTELGRRHDLAAGIVVCHPLAGHTTTARRAVADVDAAVLVALGKRPDALVEEHLTGAGSVLAGRWLAAHQVRDLLVLRAHLLPASCWTHLAGLAAAAGTRLWLVVHQPHPDPPHRAVLADLHATTPAITPAVGRPWRDALTALPPRRAELASFPPVPDSAFPLLRADARRLLDAADFARLDTTYTATFHTARAEARRWRLDRHTPHGPHASHDRVLAAAALQRLTVDATTAAETRVRVAATQAGFLREGLFLDLVPGTSLPTTINSHAPRVDQHTAARLRAIADPAAAAALTLAVATGHDAPTLRALHLTDLHDDPVSALTATMAGARYRVPTSAAPALRAHLAHRRSQLPNAHLADAHLADAAAAAPLFAGRGGDPLTTAQMRTLLAHASARTGVIAAAPAFRSVTITDLHRPLKRA